MDTLDRTNEAARMAYIGMDVHKDSIALARAPPGLAEPEYLGEIPTRLRPWRGWCGSWARTAP